MKISLQAVSVIRNDKTILQDITTDLSEDRIAIIGLNGSGKSTFVRLLNALILPSQGTVHIGDLDTVNNAKHIRRHIGFVFQNPDNQIIMPTVKEDIMFGLKNIGISKPEARIRTIEILERFNILHLLEREIHSLSGGEKQMIALANILVMNPNTIIFDEPTTMLDLKNRQIFQNTIDKLEQRAIVVTHDLDLVEKYARVIVIDNGRIAFDGLPAAGIAYYRKLCEVL